MRLAVGRTSATTTGVADLEVGGVATIEDAATGVATVLFGVLALSGTAVTPDPAGCAGSDFFGAVKFETVEGRSSNIIPSPDFRFFSFTTGAAATALGSGIC